MKYKMYRNKSERKIRTKNYRKPWIAAAAAAALEDQKLTCF